MVTSSLTSNNVPCDVYPINDKKKLKSLNKPQPITNNKSTNKGKENIAKNRSYIIENKRLNFHNTSTGSEICSDTPDPVTITTYIELNDYAKPSECRPYSENQRNSKNVKESIKEVEKILQVALCKTPHQNQGRKSFAVAEVSRGGTDTGYSSRCSTPPTTLNVGDNSSDDERREQQRGSQEPISIPLPTTVSDVHSVPRSKSPSACSDSSNGSGHFPKGRNKYQSYQSHHRYNVFHQHHSQKPLPNFFLPYSNVGTEGYNQKFDDNYGYNGRIRCQGNNGGYSSFRKNDRIPLPHGHHHYSHNSSHLQEPHENEGRHVYSGNGRHFSQGHYQRMEGRSRNWNSNPKFPPNGKNRPFGASSYHHQPNFPPNGLHHHNSSYYQLNSQHDLRDHVWGFQRTLTNAAGAFSAPSGSHGGKWVKDHRAEATVIPPELLIQSEWDSLSLQVWNMFTKHQQLDSTFRAKMDLKERISHVIWNILPMCRLFVVGSSLSGFGANSSDVDMCLMVTPRDLDQRNEAQAVLRLLQRELNNCGFVEKMELITAKVPILKFRDSRTKIDVDLNCNNSVGIRNTHLLNAYSQLDWRVRPLVLVVKLWAQHHHINNAKDMTISSYSLVLMVIHYLQYGLATPLLPCLHKAYPDKFNSSNHVFKMPVAERLPPFVSNNTQTLGQLFLGFLEYFTSKFKFIDTSISVRTGGILPTDECRYVRTKKNDSRMWKYLCIEEPFDLTNTARSVYDEVVFEKVKSVFKDSFTLLKDTKDLNAIFSKP